MNHWDSPLFQLQRRSICDFCHSDEGTSVDTNFPKMVSVTVKNIIEKHTTQVFVAQTIKKMYQIYIESNLVKRHITNHAKYCVSSESSFGKYLCPCCVRLVLQSFVDIYMFSCSQYMKTLEKYIGQNKEAANDSEGYTCALCTSLIIFRTYLNKKAEHLANTTCCARR